MIQKIKSSTPYLEKPFPLFFLIGLIVVNVIALLQVDFLFIGAFLGFLYVIVMPGFLILPLLSRKKFSPMLGLALSVALSIFVLMVVGFILNLVLPLVGIHDPLSTIPLLIAFDIVIYILLIVNYKFKENSPFEFHEFNVLSIGISVVAVLVPICACIGAMILNNGGSSFFAMAVLALAIVLVPVVVFYRDKISPSVPPLVLYLIALGFLLTNSMRGWYVSGHDILLEYHVFILTLNAHIWNIASYRDPYMACLSLTVLPTYFQTMLHISVTYMFKFFIQFIGAFPVVVVYYIVKEYVSEKVAFLAAFIYISFPTFVIDMAFLNRQGMAFLFFAALVFTTMSTEHFSGYKRLSALFIFGIGVIISHYSTSYITIAVLIAAYCINRAVRLIVKTKRPRWFANWIHKLGNREMYDQPILISLPFVVGLLALMLIWSSVVTKTSTSLFNTIQQIVSTVKHPFTLDQLSGQAHYSLVPSKQATPQELLSQFLEEGIRHVEVAKYQSEFYPLSITQAYPAIAIAETPAPLTPFGVKFQSVVRVNLVDFYGFIKQTYAKIVQVVLLIGLVGLLLGYSFKKNIIKKVPIEYLALSVAGLTVIVGQTILPAGAIDYGLLRLFQQNLIFLVLPIILGLMLLSSLVSRNHTVQLAISTFTILAFFVVLSGFLPQLTGGSRPTLPLDNAGLYYDSYYTHAQEIASIGWLTENGDHTLPIQAAHFSDMKMLAYGQIGAYIELLPQTTKKLSYEYLNYDNAITSNILEIVNGNVVYYHFPVEFLDQYKSLIYNNGGSKIYR